MSYFMLLVLHDPDLCRDVLAAWEAAGVTGVTLLPSTGPGRLRAQAGLREDLPLIPSLSDLLGQGEVRNQTLFTVVETAELKDRVVAATQGVTGDLNQPQTGILVVLPVVEAYGLNRK